MNINDIFNDSIKGMLVTLAAAAVIFIEAVVLVELFINNDTGLAVAQIAVLALTYKPLKAWYKSLTDCS